MNVEYINPFIEASQNVLQQMLGIDARLGKVFLKNCPYTSEEVLIIVGITGKMRGQVVFSMNKDTALLVASKMMCGMEVTELDDISKSAVSELANMILGNTATILFNKGVGIEITPPSLLIGSNMTVSPAKMNTVCVPLEMSSGCKMDIDISIE